MLSSLFHCCLHGITCGTITSIVKYIANIKINIFIRTFNGVSLDLQYA